MGTLFQPCSPCCQDTSCFIGKDVLYGKIIVPVIGNIINAYTFFPGGTSIDLAYQKLNNCVYCFKNKEVILTKDNSLINTWRGTYRVCSDNSIRKIIFSIAGLPINYTANTPYDNLYNLIVDPDHNHVTGFDPGTYNIIWDSTNSDPQGQCIVPSCRCVQFGYTLYSHAFDVGTCGNNYNNIFFVVSDKQVPDNYQCAHRKCYSIPNTQHANDDIYLPNAAGIIAPDNLIIYMKFPSDFAEEFCMPTILKCDLSSCEDFGLGIYVFENGCATGFENCSCNFSPFVLIERNYRDCSYNGTLYTSLTNTSKNINYTGFGTFDVFVFSNQESYPSTWLTSFDNMCNINNEDITIQFNESGRLIDGSIGLTGRSIDVIITKDGTGYNDIYGVQNIPDTLYVYNGTSINIGQDFIADCHATILGTLNKINTTTWSGVIDGRTIQIIFLNTNSYLLTINGILTYNSSVNTTSPDEYLVSVLHSYNPLVIIYYTNSGFSGPSRFISSIPPPDSDHVICYSAAPTCVAPKNLNVHVSLVYRNDLSSTYAGFNFDNFPDFTITDNCIRDNTNPLGSFVNFGSSINNWYDINNLYSTNPSGFVFKLLIYDIGVGFNNSPTCFTYPNINCRINGLGGIVFSSKIINTNIDLTPISIMNPFYMLRYLTVNYGQSEVRPGTDLIYKIEITE